MAVAVTTNMIGALAADPNLLSAWLQVRQNRGAPGLDGVTVAAFEAQLDPHLARIARNLLAGRYRPSPLRAVDIPKPDNHGTRTLGIPTVADRVVLQALAQVLSPVWEPHFSSCSFAYRPGRTALDAVWLAQQRLQSGQHWIVDLDIEKFFDHVDHVRLMQRLAQRISDAALLDLIADFLRCGLMRDGARFPTRVGIPQGSPLSPLLANIVLDELDQEYQRHGWSFVRYADDCILLAKSEAEARALLDFTREFLADRLHLRLNAAKTRIVQPAAVGFLGFTYRLGRYGKVRRRIMRESLTAFRQRILALTQRRRGQPLEAVCEQVGLFFRGWANYYRFAQDNALAAARAFACDALRACAWAHWDTPQEKFRQLQRLGVAEDPARAAAFALDFPGADDDPPLLRRVLPDTSFERYGLRIERFAPAENGDAPLTRSLPPLRAPAARPAAASIGDRERRIVFAFLARRLHIRSAPSQPDASPQPPPH